MRWGFIGALLITMAVAAAVVRNMIPSVQRQDPTRASGQPVGAPEAAPATGQRAGAPASAMVRELATGSLEVLTPGTTNLNLGRITLAPGATLPFDPMDPAAVLVYASSGALTFRVEAPMTVVRRAEPGMPVSSEPEAVAASTEFILRNGDSALVPPATRGEVRNDGEDAATIWVVNVTVFSYAASTPSP